MLDSGYDTVAVVVLDGLGVGSGASAGPDTFANVLRAAPAPLSIPNLLAMGLGDLGPDAGHGQAGAGTRAVPASLPAAARTGSSVRLVPISPGKDSLTGHWELAGLVTDIELRTFPGGIPQGLLDTLQSRLGRGLIGGKPASGTAVIEQLGRRHLRTGELIVYTSADSVLQVAAHEDVVPPEELYRLCGIAREVATGPYLVGRVIARPFRGGPGSLARFGRRDFSLLPPGPTVLEAAQAAGVEVISVGKIADVFAGRGVTTSIAAGGNRAVIEALLGLELRGCRGGGGDGGGDGGRGAAGDGKRHRSRPRQRGRRRLVIANLNDFDSLYGHRRDATGFGRALEEFDRSLPLLTPRPGSKGMLAVTADHGCDPTWPGTDHTREDVPLLVAGPGWRPARHMGTVVGLTAVAGLVAAAFGLEGFCYWPRKISGRDHQ